MTDLTIGGETFNVLIGGDETLPVLMLSNPLGADLHIWDAQIPELLKHFRIVRYNARGHRGSVTNVGPYSIAQLGRDAVAILDALGIEKTHWLGMSQGGAVGQWLLINAPDRIERAVLANTAAHFGSPDGWNERIVTAQEHGMEALADTVLARWFSPAFAASHPEQVEPVKQALLATSPDGYAAACAALRDMDLREGLLQINRPVLVIAGANDQSTTPEQASLLVETIPGARLVTLQTRHISAIEDAVGFTKAVVDFLTAKLPTRQTTTRKAALPRSIARRPAGRRIPTRGATTDTLARRAPVKGATGKAKAIATPAEAAAPTKTPRGKAAPAVSKPAAKRVAAKAAPAAKTTRKTSAAPAPAKRAAAKAAPVKTAAKPAAPARKARGAATPTKPLKTAKAVTTRAAAKAPARKTAAKTSAPVRAKATPAKRGPAKAAVAKKPAAKSSPARRPVVAAKAPAKRTVTAAAKSRTVTKARATKVPTKTAAKSAPKAAAIKTKAVAAKTKAPAKTVKAAKPAAKAARKPAAKAPAKRTASRRKA